MDWSDVVKAALSFFLVLTAIGLAFLLFRLAGVFGRLGSALTRVTDEVVPILTRTQTTVDGVNRELDRVDEIMVSAVGATKSTERAVGGVSKAITTPVRKLSALGAGISQAIATFRARGAADAADRAPARAAAPPPVVAVPPAATAAPAAPAAPVPPPAGGAIMDPTLRPPAGTGSGS